EDEVLKPREIIMEIMQHMIDRGLTDYSGGNMALRVGHRIYSTQTHSADVYRWKLKPDNIIVTDINKNILEGRQEKLSRELDLHIGILQRFPDINCTLHGNTFYSPLVVAAGVKPVGVTEVADYYNIREVPVLPEGVVPLSDEENNIIFGYMSELRKRGEALVTIMPVHGVIVAAPNHGEAFALLEAVENNSKFILFKNLLRTSMLVTSVFEKLGKGNAARQKQSGTDQTAEKPTLNIPEKSPGPSMAVEGEAEGMQEDKIKNSPPEAAASLPPGSKPQEEYILEQEVTIFTAEDLLNILKKIPVKAIKINHPCRVTDFAEIKAAEAGVKIFKQ
ncbi:MAG: class II aldolase/adducin family protein, partial [Actinobacteria bacterium]|nr:class II aldolase/adducin family protein [Actinomycetota bacterium]